MESNVTTLSGRKLSSEMHISLNCLFICYMSSQVHWRDARLCQPNRLPNPNELANRQTMLGVLKVSGAAYLNVCEKK